jgi:hypothetical protein
LPTFSKTALGVFYPLHCLVAAFPSLDAAREVARNLETKGFGRDKTITAAGAELVELEKEETGLGNYLMQGFVTIHRWRADFH